MINDHTIAYSTPQEGIMIGKYIQLDKITYHRIACLVTKHSRENSMTKNSNLFIVSIFEDIMNPVEVHK